MPLIPPKNNDSKKKLSPEPIIKLVDDPIVRLGESNLTDDSELESLNDIDDETADDILKESRTKLPTKKTKKFRTPKASILDDQSSLEEDEENSEPSDDDDTIDQNIDEELEELDEPDSELDDHSSLNVIDQPTDDVTKLKEEVLSPKKKRLYPSLEKSMQVNEANLAAETASSGKPNSGPHKTLSDNSSFGDPERQWHEQNSSPKKGIPAGWIIIAVCLAITACYLIFSQVRSGDDSIAAQQQQRARLLAEQAQKEKEEDEQLYKTIHETITDFYSAETIDELLPLCRRSNEIAPYLKNFYANKPLTPGQVERISSIQPIALDNKKSRQLSFLIIQAFIDGKRENILLEQTKNGKFLIDWESTTSYQPIEWDKYISTKPTDPLEFRVYMTLDHHYTYEFGDEDEYQCFLLQARNSDSFLFGYMKRDNPKMKSILKILSKKNTPQSREPAILTLRFTENREARNSVIIEEFKQFSWTIFE